MEAAPPMRAFSRSTAPLCHTSPLHRDSFASRPGVRRKEESDMGQPVVHWEMWSENPQKVSDFYANVFGWQIRRLPEMDYRFVETGGSGGINRGIVTPKKGPWPAKMALYIDVDDIEAYTDKIRSAGGKIVVPKTEVHGVGWLALFSDPDERLLGVWQK
jgi:predicted enzyme related to lactoylglutathione lyase